MAINISSLRDELLVGALLAQGHVGGLERADVNRDFLRSLHVQPFWSRT
jgi:hypothetical protein